ncbi:TrmB family transcriptional regulator [Clostridium drakei]|uniref:TrmB family transcriptional regulator n=1 Tax=Clostridium drakei TaxID=332101 RepID=A0A2U8DMZ6_9CLOT|nr:TrmB family transcriptional regulator [Clostridium drakei]AWI03801.1 TrmB family transcriptional regulator [Clostridium drakei]
MKDRESNVINELTKLGLNKYEAKVYVTLLETPEITAYEIGKRSGVPQSKIYDTVNKLASKCMLILSGSDPVKYVPIPLEEFLNRYKKETEHSIKYLKENMSNINNNKYLDYMWHLQGENQCNDKIRYMIGNAKKSIYLDIWANNYKLLYDDLVKANDRGVKIVCVVYGTIEKEIGKVYYHEMYGMEEDADANGRWLCLVTDDSESLFSIFKDEESSAVWTQNKSFMLSTECFITHDIFISEIYLKYKDSLDEEFGFNLEKIRKKLPIG